MAGRSHGYLFGVPPLPPKQLQCIILSLGKSLKQGMSKFSKTLKTKQNPKVKRLHVQTKGHWEKKREPSPHLSTPQIIPESLSHRKMPFSTKARKSLSYSKMCLGVQRGTNSKKQMMCSSMIKTPCLSCHMIQQSSSWAFIWRKP